MKKLSRTLSGVTPVAVMTKPSGCPGRCVYCPTYADTPQSYTPESPAVLRAEGCGYDVRRQVEVRLDTLTGMGHPVEKVELIIMGGTFLSTPVEYQYEVVKDCYDALNGFKSDNLFEAQHHNQVAARRCVGLCVETRPDVCGEVEIGHMLDFGATRVELGVQVLDDAIYSLVRRGHSVADVVNATALLKRYGLKVYYHWMPGLPGSTVEHDLEMAERLFDDPDFRPDGLKLYPTMVVGGTVLEDWFVAGHYQPYADDAMVKLIAAIKARVPEYVRISRVLRDIPAKYIVGGLKDSIRERIRELMSSRGEVCRCIRCREYGHRMKTGYEFGEPRLHRLDYAAAGGREIFLSFADDGDTLFGLLRLRIENDPPACLRRADPLALVRELHVFGSELPLGTRGESSAQHRGLGRALLEAAENIAKAEFAAREMAILSAVGVRPYYADAGYHLEAGYMVKSI